MAKAREIKNRIKSVKGTKKITRTMEMVSTVKAKRATNRINDSRPYLGKLNYLLQALLGLGQGLEHPLTRKAETKKRSALLLVTSNRGLCGGFNSNIIKAGREYMQQETEASRDVDLYVVGKKGAIFFEFLGVNIKEKFITFDDQPTYAQVEEVAGLIETSFLNGEIDGCVAAYTKYISSGSQVPTIEPLLPVEITSEENSDADNIDYIWDPPPAELASELIPLFYKTNAYRIFIENVAGEMIARRVAMKNATDNADDMIKTLTRYFNRARQGQITQELIEIVSGAQNVS